MYHEPIMSKVAKVRALLGETFQCELLENVMKIFTAGSVFASFSHYISKSNVSTDFANAELVLRTF